MQNTFLNLSYKGKETELDKTNMKIWQGIGILNT